MVSVWLVSIVRLFLCLSLSCVCELLFPLLICLGFSCILYHHRVSTSYAFTYRQAPRSSPSGAFGSGTGNALALHTHCSISPLPSYIQLPSLHLVLMPVACQCPQIDDRSIRCASCTRRRLRRSRTVGPEFAHTIFYSTCVPHQPLLTSPPMPYVVAVPGLCICSFFLVFPFPIDWPPHGGPCRRTWTDIVGRPGSGNRYNCTNAMGAGVDLLASTTFNKLPLPPTASDDGSALQDSPSAPFIMHHGHSHMRSRAL